MFRSISCGINNTGKGGERRQDDGGERRGRGYREAAGETINYRSSALSSEIPAELLATDILNLHRRPGESFVRISLRESREKPWGREPGQGGRRWEGVIHFASCESRGGYLIRSPRAPVVYSQTHSVNAPGTLISSFSLNLARPMYSGNKIFLSF